MGELLLESPDAATWQGALLSMLVAYLYSQAIGAVYVWTHRGISYSRSLVVTLVAAGLVSTILMLAIGNNLARGLGIVGTLALIRFRTSLFDPLDMIYVFASFASGVAAGTGNFVTGAIGTTAFLLVVGLLQASEFGAIHRHDGVLRVQLPAGGGAEAPLALALAAHCRRFVAVSLREVGQGREIERVYHVTLRDPARVGSLVDAVTALEGARGVSVTLQEASHEL